MLKVPRSAVVLAVLFGLFAVANVALAEHEEGHPEDTYFSFGYDAVNHFLAINIHPNDVETCVLENGPLDVTFGDPEDGIYAVEVDGLDDVCSVAGIVVAGPNGQVNHGQFMKAAKGLFDMRGHGCVVRHLAKSEIGKGDTQIKTPDVDDAFEIADGGEITFTTFEADCSKDEKSKKDKGRPDSPGKSNDAPGRNK